MLTLSFIESGGILRPVGVVGRLGVDFLRAAAALGVAWDSRRPPEVPSTIFIPLF